jgi:hypothetical protein
MLDTICKDLSEGADIGCTGQHRQATFSGNAPSAYEFAEQVTDSIADWISAGFAAGPFDPRDRPARAKVNGMMCHQKPNGSARIILNLSAPKGRSVNDGIRSDDFPTTMSSTKKWLEVLDKAGRGAEMVKIDWASAYKHAAVRLQDIELQFFHWLGRDFVELCLVFGGRSSAGIYDRLAKLVLNVVILFCNFPAEMVCQYLDDVCAAAPSGCLQLAWFEAAYREVADHIGVQLAPTTDPDKAFSAATAGVVLGVHYDTVAWTWSIPQEKLSRLLHQIRTAMTANWLCQCDIWSLVGRILHYTPLVPSGKYNISALIKAHGHSTDRYQQVELTPPFKQQLQFWWIMLKTVDSVSSIRGRTHSQPGPLSFSRTPPAVRQTPSDSGPADTEGPSGFTFLGVTELTPEFAAQTGNNSGGSYPPWSWWGRSYASVQAGSFVRRNQSAFGWITPVQWASGERAIAQLASSALHL